MANYAPARVNPVNHRFDPPHRKVSFNKLLIHNDGLLAAYVAQKENERYEEALSRVKDYVVYLKTELREQKKLELENVGILFQQADGTYRFEQMKDAKMFADGFGLESFFSKRVKRQPGIKTTVEPKAEQSTPVQPVLPKPEPKVIPIKAEEKAPVAVTDKKAEKEAPKEHLREKPAPESKKKKASYWPVAAAALIGLPVIGYAVWVALSTPLITNTSHFRYADLNPFSEREYPAYVTRTSSFDGLSSWESMEPMTDDGEQFLTLRAGNERDKTLVVRLSETETRLATASQDLHYHIVGGCFSMPDNAEGLVTRFRKRGTNASLIDVKGGLHRVSIASYATKKEAQQALASFQIDIPGAWLLYK